MIILTEEAIKEVDYCVDEYKKGACDAIQLTKNIMRALELNTDIIFPRLHEEFGAPDNFCNDPQCMTCNDAFAEGHMW